MNKVNTKRKNTKMANILLVEKIVQEHHTWRLQKIKQHLKEDYSVSLSDITLKRYKKELLEIAKTHKKEKRNAEKAKQQEVKQKTTLVKKRTFPFEIRDPANKPHIIQSEIQSISLTWSHEDGMREPLTWGPVSQGMDFWHWENSGIRYGEKSSSRTPRRIPLSREQRWARTEGDCT